MAQVIEYDLTLKLLSVSDKNLKITVHPCSACYLNDSSISCTKAKNGCDSSKVHYILFDKIGEINKDLYTNLDFLKEYI